MHPSLPLDLGISWWARRLLPALSLPLPPSTSCSVQCFARRVSPEPTPERLQHSFSETGAPALTRCGVLVSPPFHFVRDTVFSRRRVSLTRLARFCFVRTCVQRPPDATLQSEMPAQPLTFVTRGRRADHCDPQCPSSRDFGNLWKRGTKWAKGCLLLFPASFNRNILSVAVITAPTPLSPFFSDASDFQLTMQMD